MGNSNRPAQGAAEIVLPERRFLYVLIAIKPIVRVEHIVAQILEGSAVPLVGPRFRVKRKLAARIAPVFRRVR